MTRVLLALVMVAVTSTACLAGSKTTASTAAAKPPAEDTRPEPGPKAKAKTRPATRGNEILEGRAVWYGEDWHGKATASGERFDMHAMTAAHRDLPLGSTVKVTNLKNGKSVVVRINDRGPYGKDRRRIIDVSLAAAKQLGFVDAGWTPVTVEVLSRPAKKASKKKSKKKSKK